MAPLKVSVVCTGNICRSPFAERLLAVRLAEAGFGATLSSCGTGAMVGWPAAERTLQVAAEDYDLDLTDHRGRQVTQAIVDEHDLLLAMTAQHVEEVRHRFTGASAKTLTMRSAAWRAGVLRTSHVAADQWVGQLVHAAPAANRSDDVRDPYGGSLKLFRSVSSEIAELVEALVRSWPRA